MNRTSRSLIALTSAVALVFMLTACSGTTYGQGEETDLCGLADASHAGKLISATGQFEPNPYSSELTCSIREAGSTVWVGFTTEILSAEQRHAQLESNLVESDVPSASDFADRGDVGFVTHSSSDPSSGQEFSVSTVWVTTLGGQFLLQVMLVDGSTAQFEDLRPLAEEMAAQISAEKLTKQFDEYVPRSAH